MDGKFAEENSMNRLLLTLLGNNPLDGQRVY